MYLQKFLKKFTEIFSKDNLEQILNNNFKDIIIIISAIGALIIILIIIFNSFCFKKIDNNKKSNIEIDKNINTQMNLESSDYSFITAEEFVIPEIKSFDLSSDFIDFLPTKKFQIPDKSIINKNNDILINDSIQDSYKFNFEKKSLKGDN